MTRGILMGAALILVAMSACDEESPPVQPQPGDTSDPSAVADLRARLVTGESVDLWWTASGDDGSTGTAASYDIRYATVALSGANWSAATQVTSPPVPQSAGGAEAFRVAGLAPTVTYYFGIKARDESGNTSALSNVIVAATHGAIDYYVDARNGDDSFAGTLAEPLKTITHALQLASAGDSIRVLPGVYDEALGEVFPLVVEAGITIFGDEAAKGSGEDSTSVIGGGLVGGTNQSAAFRARSNTVIAGFRITNDSPETPSIGFPHGVMVLGPTNADNVVIRNNTLVRNTAAGVYFFNSSGHWIHHNVFVDNVRGGLMFTMPGSNIVVEHNVLMGATYGIEMLDASTPPDCGGGPAGSAGGNTISCNTLDMIIYSSSKMTVWAINNAWDHVPPTEGSANGFDIAILSDSVLVDATGAQQAQPGCR